MCGSTEFPQARSPRETAAPPRCVTRRLVTANTVQEIETPDSIHPAPDNPSRSVGAFRTPETVAADTSSHGWAHPGRAPALRRYAEILTDRAETSRQPDRVRQLAREMRLRASELELGPHATDEVEEFADQIRALGSFV